MLKTTYSSRQYLNMLITNIKENNIPLIFFFYFEDFSEYRNLHEEIDDLEDEIER